MAGPRFQGELVEDTTSSSPRFGGGELVEGAAPISEPVAGEPKTKTLRERGTQLLEAIGGGAALGAVSPEATQLVGKGIQKLPVPYAKPVGMGLQQAGKLMQRQRLTETGIGAVGGGTADIAGQSVEISGGSSPMVFAAELAGGFAGPAFMNTIKNVVSYGARKLFGMDSGSALKAIADDLNIDEKTLSPSQRDAIKKQIEELRGGEPSSKSQESLYDVLKTGVLDITGEAEKRALAKKAEAELAQRGAETQAEKMRLAGKKTTQIGAETAAQAKAARASVGVEREASDVGNTLRNKITELFGNIAEKRSAEYKAQKAIRDAAVAEKELAGEFVRNMPEYKDLLSNLRGKLLIGAEAQTQKTAPVTEKGVLQAYQNIYDAVSARRVQVGVNEEGNPIFKTFPTSFDALDDVRRRLGDVAFGKEVEGYSAIGSDIAKTYYGKISELQSKFAGESHDALQGGYEMASRLLDKYRSRVGKKTTAIDRFDPTRFATDPASLPNTYFSSQQSVRDLLELTGNDRNFVLKEASDFTARQLRDKNATGVKSWINSNSDWLTALPEVRTKVNSYLQTLERAERVAGKTTKAGQILEAKEPTILRAGEKAVATGEKAAGEIRAEAAQRVKTILGDSNPARRVREIILGGKPSEWAEIGPILAASPEGKRLITESVQQIMADRASTGLTSSIVAFREDVAPSLRAAGLMSDAQLSSLEAQLRAIANSALGEPAKLTLLQRTIKNALIGVSAQPVGSFIFGAANTGKSLYDVINKKDSPSSAVPRFAQ
jgi:hypothetical protein